MWDPCNSLYCNERTYPDGYKAIKGEAIKGPTAKMMAEMDIPRTAVEVARLYRDFLSGFVLDEMDADDRERIERLGLKAGIAQTVMTDDRDKADLARYCLDFLGQLREGR